MELVAFLRARLDEDEQVARATDCSDIEAVEYLWDTKYLQLSGLRVQPAVTAEVPASLADHIARHDPARVLAEVDAKRRMLDEYAEAMDQSRALRDTPHSTQGSVRLLTSLRFLKLLALPYADHPDYHEEWRP